MDESNKKSNLNKPLLSIIIPHHGGYDILNQCLFSLENSTFNDYEKGTTHPLDKAHQDAVQLITPTFKKIKGGK